VTQAIILGSSGDHGQSSRLERTVRGMEPNYAVQFIPASGTRVRFRIMHRGSGRVLAWYSGAWRPVEIARRSDQELRVLVFLMLAGMIF
jgi:hypothetical protein